MCSVALQTFQPHEVIVVNDGSAVPLDNSIKDLCKLVRITSNEQNLGVASARNCGIRIANGEWIALLDSDDEWEPEKLEKQIEYSRKFPQMKVFHTLEKWIRNGNEVNPPKYLDKSPDRIWERSLKHCLICPSSVLIHQSIFDSVGYFDESLLVCEDYDFWLRLLLEDSIGLVAEKLTIKHGGHPDQLSRTTWGMDRFRVKALQKILTHPLLTIDRRLLVLEVLIEKYCILAQGAKKRKKLEEAQNYENHAEKYLKQIDQEKLTTHK